MTYSYSITFIYIQTRGTHIGIALHNLEYTESYVYELNYSIIIIIIIVIIIMNLEFNVGVLIFRLILIATKGSNQTYLIIALILFNFLIKKLAFQMDYEFII